MIMDIIRKVAYTMYSSPSVLLLVAYFVIFGCIGFLCLCGDPNGIWSERILGKRFFIAISSVWNYILFKPNPILQIAYLILIIGGYIMCAITGFPLVPNIYVSEYHKTISGILALLALTSFFVACKVSPGVITTKTIDKYNNYEYDGWIYNERECETCRIPKLPRSKHCRICNCCVSRFDHHCPWINSCVGENNYRWFLLFLLSNSVFLLYGAFIGGMSLVAYIEERRLFTAGFINTSTGQRIEPSYAIVFRYLLRAQGNNVMLFILTVVMGMVLLCFLCYHLYLVYCNMTTNEAFKWKLLCSHIAKENASMESKSSNITPDEIMHQYQKVPEYMYNLGSMHQNMLEVLFPRSFTYSNPPTLEKSQQKKKSRKKKQKQFKKKKTQ